MLDEHGLFNYDAKREFMNLFRATFGHRRRRVYRAGVGVPVLIMTASTGAFQRCVARAYILVAYVVVALYSPHRASNAAPRRAAQVSAMGCMLSYGKDTDSTAFKVRPI